MVIRGECEALMNTDLNGKIQGKLNQNRKNRNTKKVLLVLSLAAVIFTSTVLANPASALTEDVSGEVVQGLENGGDSGSGAQAPVQAAVEQADAQGNEAAPSSDPQETLAAPSADQGVMNANSVSAVDSAAVTENGTEDSGIAVSGAEADGTKKSADQISAAEGTGTAEQGATLAEAAETVSTEEAAADKTTEKTEQAAQSETDVLSFADDRAQVKIARKDGTGFPSDTTMSGSPLGTDDWNRVLSAVSSKVKAQSDDSTAYSVAGLHTWTLSLQAGDGSAASYDDIRAEAEFQGGLNDAGYATKTSEKEENGTDGTSTTTASYETSWRVYAISGDSIADPVEDHLTDLTDADGTSLSVDENGALQSAAFDGSLPETVVFAQIVRETVTTGTEKKKEIPMPAVTFDKEAATDHGTITVHVEADEGTFEQGTTMSVKRVSSQDILDKAIEAAGGRGSAAAVDISFRKADGTETEPAKPIRVKMTAKVLSQADKVHVVHVDDTGNTDVVARKSDGKTIESTSSEAASSDAKNTVSFESDSFSVYAIVYTVDFEYSVNGKIYQFSLHGGKKITLSDLVEVLGIIDDTNNGEKAAFNSVDSFLKEVADVKFSDESLVKVTKNEEGNDWTLESLQAFDTEESLAITMKNGDVVTVKVTDSQAGGDLAAFVTDATLVIDGKTYGAGTTWNVRPDVDYKLTLNFLEKGLRQLPGGGQEITMAMPSGLSLEPGVNGSFDIPCGLAGTLTGNTWWVDERGILHIKFADDPDDLITRSSNIHFDLALDAKFDGSENHFEFNNNVKRDAEFNYDTDVDVQKSGSYNASTGKMEYTVTVKSTGKSKNVKVIDAISGNMLTLDENSFEITPSGKTPSSTSTNSKGFTMTFGEMAHDETVTIKYTASVDTSKIGPGGKVTGDDGKNSVTVTNDDNKTDTAENITNTIKFSDIAKSSTSSEETADGEKVEMEWKITANEGHLGSIKGSKITDTIDHGSKDIMHYVVGNDGKLALSVKKIAPDGTSTTETVYVDVSKTYDQGPETWTWIPQDEGNYAYEITYKTLVTKQTENTTVKNNTSNESGGSTSGTGVVPGTNPGGGGGGDDTDIVAGKAATNVTPEYIDWDIVVNIPAKGYPDGLEIIENIPYFANAGFSDSFVEVLDVDGLVNNESYTAEKTSVDTDEEGNVIWNLRNAGKTRDVVTFKFYQNANKTDPGLDAQARTLTIKIRTKNDQEWMKYAEPRGGGDEAYYHRNNASINGSKVTASAIPLHSSMLKELDKTSSTNDGLPVYEYKITLTNVREEPLTITDTFDTSELCVYGDGLGDPYSNRDKIAAAEQKNNLNGGNDPAYKITVIPTETGIRIDANSLPKKQDGSFYEYYQIYYRLQVKDADALNKIKAQALANGGTYKIGNTAVWEDITSHNDVEYKVPGLSKTGYFSNSHNNRQYTFILDINREGLTMNGGESMDLLDTHSSNLSVDYSTVKVYKITDGQSKEDAQQYTLTDDMLTDEVTWNFDANEGTFSIPDHTHYVIKYNALVIGSGNQSFKNEAELKGYRASKEDSKDYGSDSHAGGSINQINLLKYEAGQTSKGLQGAVFQLFKGTGEYDPVTGDEIKEELKYGKSGTRPDGTTFAAGDNITFTTGADGTVLIALDQTRHGEQLDTGVHYYLKEIDSPPGYQIDSSVEYWEFTLTDDPDEVNYGDPDRRDENGRRQWIYFSFGDILKMANTSTVKPLDVVVKKQWFDEDGNEITGKNLNQNYKAKIQLMRKTDSGDYVKVKVSGSGSNLTVTEVSDNSGEIELNSDNNWAYTWSQLPRVEYGGQGGMEIKAHYAYKVEEVSVEGYVSSVSETENETTKTYALKNYKVPENRNTEVTVKKEWQDVEGNVIPGTTEKLPDSITFSIYQVTSKTPFTRVPSSGGNKYIISGDSHLLEGGADDTNDNYGLYQISKGESWTATFSNLPSVVTVNGETTYYAYYVKEEALTGYKTTYTSDGTTRTIVNREPLDENSKYIDIGLEKKWTDGTNTTPPNGASATFTVHQQKNVKSGGSSGNLSVQLVYDDNGEEVVVCTRRANVGDNISFSYSGAPSSGTNVNVYWKGRYGGEAWEWQYLNYIGGGSSSFSTEINNAWVNNNTVKLKVDKSFATGCEEGPAWDAGEPTWSGFTNTEWTREVTLPIGSNWSTAIKDLIQEDAEGNLYRYYITEDSCTPTATASFKDDLGKDIAHAISTNGQKVEVTNTYENEMGAVKVTKSFSGVDSLPTEFQISNNYNDTVFTVSSTGMTGTGTAADPYVWILDNVPVGTEVTFTESGATVDGAALTITANGTAVEAGSETATAKATSAKVETGGEYPTAAFVNEYEQTTDFEFSKIWKDDGSQPTKWPTGATITVTLNAYTDTNQKAIDDVQVTLSAEGSAAGVTPAWTATTSAEGTVTTFKVEGLPKYKDGIELHYYVIETQVDGYKAPAYAISEGNGLVFTGSDVTKATNGQQIINTPEGGYELPSTGGHGTLPLTGAGAFLLLLAGTALTVRKLQVQRNAGKGGGSE